MPDLRNAFVTNNHTDINLYEIKSGEISPGTIKMEPAISDRGIVGRITEGHNDPDIQMQTSRSWQLNNQRPFNHTNPSLRRRYRLDGTGMDTSMSIS
jgi:hypothetical protein